MRILALDVGSSSVKAGLWHSRRFLSRTKVDFPTRFSGLQVEVRPQALLAAIDQAARNALGTTREIDAVSFCAFSSGVVVTDPAGRVRAGIITHADRRSTDIAKSLVQHAGKNFWLSRTANLPYPGGIGASTLAWLHHHHPRLFKTPCRVGQVANWIASTLTGQWISDPSQAVFLGLWDIRKSTWSEEACQAVGIPLASLPTVKPADQIIGRLTPRIANRWNLKPGTPLFGGFVDTSAAVIQTPMATGQLVHNTGSTDVLALCIPRPKPREGVLTRPVGVGSTWLAVRTIAAAGSALQWARRVLFSAESDRQWTAVLRRVAAGNRQDEEFSVHCDPRFAGDRVALEQGVGANFTGLTLGTTPDDLLKALFRALIAQSTKNYEILAGIHPPARRVYAMGGAAELASAMHNSWPNHHFQALNADSLQGLIHLPPPL